MNLRPVSDADREAWQGLLARLPSGDLLHDWEWAAVAAHDGEPQHRYVLESEGELVALCAAQVRPTALGRSIWYVPRGPVLDYHVPPAAERLRAVVAGIGAAARREGGVVVRFEPRVEAGSPAADLFDRAGLRRVDATLQTPQTYLVELADDETLMARFDKDTRYAIRRAAREGVETRVISDPGDDPALERLHTIVTETLRHHRHRLPSLERYRIAWRGLAAANRARIIEAWYRGEIESAAMLVGEGDRSFYLYSGLRREEKGETKRYPSYAVQWRMMQTAREMGAKLHDLWGVAPLDAGPDHPWYGYSLFKKGFGGRYVAWAGSWDLPVSPLLYRAREYAFAVRSRLARR